MQSRYSQLNPKKYREEDMDVYHGFWKGQQVAFSRMFRGHRFTDEECKALCRGERLEVHNIKGRNCLYAVQGRLESMDYGVGPMFRFVALDTIPNNPDWKYGMPLYELPESQDEEESSLKDILSQTLQSEHSSDISDVNGVQETMDAGNMTDTRDTLDVSSEMESEEDDMMYLDDDEDAALYAPVEEESVDDLEMDFPDSDYDDIFDDGDVSDVRQVSDAGQESESSVPSEVSKTSQESDVSMESDVSEEYQEYDEEDSETEDDKLAEGFVFATQDDEEIVMTDEEWAMFLEEDHQIYEELKDRPLDNPAEPVTQEMLDSVKNRVA